MRRLCVGWLLAACMALPRLVCAQANPPGGKAARLWVKFTGDSTPPGKPHVIFYPSIGYSPETRGELGIGGALLFNAKGDMRNRQSAITGLAFYTLRQQYGVWSDHSIYTHNDDYVFLGRYRVQRYPLYYFGVGPTTSRADNFLVESNYLLARERILRRLVPNLFFGLQIDYQKLWNVRLSQLEPADTAGQYVPPGFGGSGNLGFGGVAIYDTRRNYLNARKGVFVELSALRYDKAWGSGYTFATYLLDARGYFNPFHKNQTLAVQVLVQSVADGKAPFNQLALLGSEQMMRGYYMGRFRDNHYAAAQAEYRFLPFPFSQRVGGTVFGAMGDVAPRLRDMHGRDFKWAAGAGLRYLLLRSKDVFVRLDVALTREQPGIYFFMGEAF